MAEEATERCRVCWHFHRYCTCAMDALNASLPNRCVVCGWGWDYCICIERPKRVEIPTCCAYHALKAQLAQHINREWLDGFFFFSADDE